MATTVNVVSEQKRGRYGAEYRAEALREGYARLKRQLTEKTKVGGC